VRTPKSWHRHFRRPLAASFVTVNGTTGRVTARMVSGRDGDSGNHWERFRTREDSASSDQGRRAGRPCRARPPETTRPEFVAALVALASSLALGALGIPFGLLVAGLLPVWPAEQARAISACSRTVVAGVIAVASYVALVLLFERLIFRGLVNDRFLAALAALAVLAATPIVCAAVMSDAPTVTLRATFEPFEPDKRRKLTGMIQGAFQQSLESLRHFVDDELAWDVS
jgi:hypothetical protein